MLSLSQVHFQPLGDNDENVNATQYHNEVGEDVMEDMQYVHEACTNLSNEVHNEIV